MILLDVFRMSDKFESFSLVGYLWIIKIICTQIISSKSRNYNLILWISFIWVILSVIIKGKGLKIAGSYISVMDISVLWLICLQSNRGNRSEVVILRLKYSCGKSFRVHERAYNRARITELLLQFICDLRTMLLFLSPSFFPWHMINFLYVVTKDDWMSETIAQRHPLGFRSPYRKRFLHARLRLVSRQYLNIAIFERRGV